ncbi:MAG: type II toxin-antitoxin system VapC family toxin [Planctomycetota bacterium]
MIILDTNVISEVMRAEPDEAVVRWFDRQPASSVWTTSVTIYEIEFGLRRMAEGKRRNTLERLFRELISEELGGRILSLDAEAALASGALGAALQASGKNVDVRDVLIAGIARARQATVATRNVSDFENSCQVLNPWEDA